MLITVYRDALRYAERYAFSTSPFTETYKDTQKRLRTWHTETLRTTEAYPDSLPELANISYTETVFLFPEQVFNLLEKYKAVKSPVLVDKLNDVYNRREGSEYTLPSQLTERYRGIIHGSREFKRRYALWETLLQYANKAYIDEHKDSDEYLKMCLKISEFNAEKRKNEPIV